MTVRDMHIEVEQSVAVVAANRTRKYLPEEIDWVLNKQMGRFIQSRLKPRKDSGGFEIDQVGADSIRNLITNTDIVPYIIDPLTYKCFFPPDYAYLISDSSFTTLNCGRPDPALISNTLFITNQRQERSALSAPPYYANMQLVMPNGSVIIPTALPYGNSFAGYQDINDVSFLVPWICYEGELYWERFDDIYLPGRYIYVGLTAPAGSIFIIVDGTSSFENSTSTKAFFTHTAGPGKERSNRLTASSLVSDLQQAAFYKTTYYSPISELENNTLKVYRDNSFTVSNVSITYVRKPQPISLYLNTDCEINPLFHQTICDLAVEYLKGRLNDPEGTNLARADIMERVAL